jgi:hypothetical protein
VLVAPLGYSRSAERRIHGTAVELYRLAERDAVRLNWRELARAVFPWDEGFHREMGDAFDAVMVDSDIKRATDALEAVAFEEWEAATHAIFRRIPDRATTLVRSIAASHFDEGWRYNAIRFLDERGEMDVAFAFELASRERDLETLELLDAIINSCRSDARSGAAGLVAHHDLDIAIEGGEERHKPLD